MAITHSPSRRRQLARLARFLSVGAGGTALDITLLTLLKTAGVATLPATVAGFSAGVVNNYTWHRLWTFADRPRGTVPTQFLQFLVVSAVGLLLNSGIVPALELLFEPWLPGWGYLPAKMVATGVVVFWNFGANALWTFQPVAEASR